MTLKHVAHHQSRSATCSRPSVVKTNHLQEFSDIESRLMMQTAHYIGCRALFHLAQVGTRISFLIGEDSQRCIHSHMFGTRGEVQVRFGFEIWPGCSCGLRMFPHPLSSFDPLIPTSRCHKWSVTEPQSFPLFHILLQYS